ncbi:hypothetical protein BLNAU_4975 [Blattamonas nauphoetae]|uniref:Uncharacterized protein n=1 Tax=Blattamonas nauphoetae TaxID=2049346 RepID=A0ABQ9Y8K0_9EUKA|nr:hypothetical protein BLNAU_4975 [Blattamonas nauphoetae]
MNDESVILNPSIDACLSDTSEPPSTVMHKEDHFLHFDANSELSFQDKSKIYNSLVALVKADDPFAKALQDRAVQFLKSLVPKFTDRNLAHKLVTDLVPSSDGSLSGFIESITTLLSSPHSTVVATTLSFLKETTGASSSKMQCQLVESDLITKVFAAVQPHTLPIAANKTVINTLIQIIFFRLTLASPHFLGALGLADAVETYNHREMIFQKVVLPSSQFVTFLISNRHSLKENLLFSFMYQLSTFLRIGPFHRPTLEYVLASPIVMAFSSCLSIVEDNGCHCDTLTLIGYSLREWKNHGHEVIQCNKRKMQALISEGFENTLEHMLMHEKSVYYGLRVVEEYQSVTSLLGFNARRQ